MPITIYNDVIMPNSVLSAGVRGKNMRNNTRTEARNGSINVNVNWSKTLRQYEIGTVPMLLTSWQAIEGLHEVTDGGAYGFLMEDPKDHNVATGEGLLYPYTTDLIGTNGLGYGLPTYKLHKRYTSVGSTRVKDRAITRPRSPIVIKRDASTVTPTVNYDTGLITFSSDASQAISSITAGASTVLNFADGLGIVAAMSVGQRVYLTGLSGTAAATLNGLSHAITAKGAASLTISTVTTGLAATGGTAKKYPQASEALTWSGKFYVPVHFESDNIDWELLIAGYDEARYLAGPSVVLNEVRE